jgi:transposase
MTTRAEAEELREKIYPLYLKGLTHREIAEAVKISHSQVTEHIKALRERNMRWFDSYKDPTGRMRRLLKEAMDGMREVLREQWYTYSQARSPAGEDKPASVSVRSGILSNILNTYTQIYETLGIKAPMLDEYGFTETIKQLQTELDNFKNELNQKAKITSLA